VTWSTRAALGIQPGAAIILLVVGVLSMFYAFGPLAESEHAGWLLPGPVRFRRVVVGITGAFALVGGVAALVG
jgi:hypothetical protein